MKIYESEAKELLRKSGIRTPLGELAFNPQEVREAAARLGQAVVIKAQTLAKSRGKAGLITFAETPEEAAEVSAGLFGRQHDGERVEALLVEQKVPCNQELYLGVTIDYTEGRPIFLASGKGGVDIEQIADEQPEMIFRVSVEPSRGLTGDQARDLARFLTSSMKGAGPEQEKILTELALRLYEAFTGYDCEMVEVNPLAATNGSFVALDAAMVIDDDALFRHPELIRPRGQSEEEFARESEYRKRGWTYIRMDGDIGILSSGAGITMAILDLLRASGGRPANFLDTAQMDRQGIYDALHIFQGDLTIKTVLIHIFAGLNRCDDLAEGIKDFFTEQRPTFNVVVRMVGNREDEGKEILKSIGLEAIRGLEEAVQKTIQVTREQT